MTWTLYDYIVFAGSVVFLYYPLAMLAGYVLLFLFAPGVLRK
jgi:hypothetical protein